MSKLPSLDDLKAQARRLRAHFARADRQLTHSQALEALAHMHGFRDWNACAAAAGTALAHKPVWQVDQWVRGHYMGQPFTGEIRAVEKLRGGFHRLTVCFDDPVDVVATPHMKAERKRVTAVVRGDGTSARKRGDGSPHLELRLD